MSPCAEPLGCECSGSVHSLPSSCATMCMRSEPNTNCSFPPSLLARINSVGTPKPPAPNSYRKETQQRRTSALAKRWEGAAGARGVGLGLSAVGS